MADQGLEVRSVWPQTHGLFYPTMTTHDRVWLVFRNGQFPNTNQVTLLAVTLKEFKGMGQKKWADSVDKTEKKKRKIMQEPNQVSSIEHKLNSVLWILFANAYLNSFSEFI